MDLGKFIKAFGTGYKHMNEQRNPETGRVTHLSKPCFCRALLCAITRDETYVFNRSEKDFESYYRNTDRRSLHPIAEIMIDQDDIDREKFKRFLEKYIQYFSREKLLENFQKYLPNTNKDSLFDDMTAAFVEIIQEAAAEPDMRRKCPAPVSAENGQDKNVISSDDRCNIKKIITQLFRTVDKLMDCSIRLLVNMNELDDENRRVFEKCLDEFMEQNAELYLYAACYPHLTILNQIHTLANILDFSAKYEVTEQGLMIQHDPKIEEYRQYLQQFARLIQK